MKMTDEDDENAGGEDCISELQFYKRKNKVKLLCTLQALHTWNRKHIPMQQGISLTIKEQNGRKFRDTAGDKDKFLLDFVSLQSFPLAHTSLCVCPLPPGAPECKQHISFSPMHYSASLFNQSLSSLMIPAWPFCVFKRACRSTLFLTGLLLTRRFAIRG